MGMERDLKNKLYEYIHSLWTHTIVQQRPGVGRSWVEGVKGDKVGDISNTLNSKNFKKALNIIKVNYKKYH